MLVIFGRDEVELDSAGAVEVGTVQARLKSFLGVPHDAVAIVEGVKVGPEHLVQPNGTVEFRKEQGQKGVGRVWTLQEYCQLFGLSEKDLEQQIREGLKVMHLSDGTIRISETATDEFIHGLNGGGDGAYLAVIASSLKRITDHVDPPPADIIGTDYISGKLGVTKVWVAKMAAEGMIPKNCIVPGTGIGKPWKFYRSKIDPWILMR